MTEKRRSAREEAVAALSEEEREHALWLMRRCDALNAAYQAVLKEEDWANSEAKGERLADLDGLREDAQAAFEFYQELLGLPE